MTAHELLETVREEQPPKGLQVLVEAMWWEAHGNWEHAHQIAQDVDTQQAARVHAYLHRAEGDKANAGFWYARASQPMCRASLPEEWMSVVEALLHAS